MSLINKLNLIEPTHLLQTILAKEVEVSRNKYSYSIIQKGLQSGLLLSASIVGIGACASEILSLVPDAFCKSSKRLIRGAKHVINRPVLDKLYQTLPERPSLSYRVERIISQALGIEVSLFGIILGNNWTIQQHLSLRNYVPPSRQGPLPAIPKVFPSLINPPHISIPIPIPPAVKPPIIEAANPSLAPSVPAESPPPPPPPPPPPTSTSSSTKESSKKTPINLVAEIQGTKKNIEAPESQEKQNPKRAMLKRDKTKFGTLRRAIDRRSIAMRPTSKNIQSVNINEGYNIKANETSLREILKELDADFFVQEDQLENTLSEFIFDKCGGYPEEGTLFSFEGFTIKIIKLSTRGGVELVKFKYI